MGNARLDSVEQVVSGRIIRPVQGLLESDLIRRTVALEYQPAQPQQERRQERDRQQDRNQHNQKRNQQDKAIDDFSKAISLSPNSPEPYNGRGISYIANKDLDNAFADFNHAIDLDNKVAESWSNQALVYEQRGDKAKAQKSYQHALNLDPRFQPAKDGLARLRG